MARTLDEHLNDEPSEAPVTEQVAETVETQDGQPRDEHGRFATKGEEEGAPPAPEAPAFEGAATIAERKGRQAAEQDRDGLRAELEALKQQFQQLQPKEEAAPAPSIWDDEKGWQDNFGQQVVQQASFNAALNMSEMLTRRENADFDQMKVKFLEMAEQNPAIVQQALSDPDPWAKAYAIAKNAATMAELGATNLDELKAKIREELAAEMGQTVIPPSLPPTLTGERSVGARSGPAWAGPKTLEQHLQ